MRKERKRKRKKNNNKTQKVWLKSTKTWIMYNLRSKGNVWTSTPLSKTVQNLQDILTTTQKRTNKLRKKFYKSLQKETTFTTLSPIRPGAQSSLSADLELRHFNYSLTKIRTEHPFGSSNPGIWTKKTYNGPYLAIL